jgi:hypothetical protein
MITPARVPEIRNCIVEYLRAHGPTDAVTIRDALGLKHGTCSSQLCKGCELGIFRRVGGSKKPGWIFGLGDGKPKPKPVIKARCLTPPSYRQQQVRERMGMK